VSQDAFIAHRSLLFTVAYEMLGSVADAEDVAQEAWLRWAALDEAQRGEVRDARAYLVRIVTRLGLNRLRMLARQREDYVGQWLPEPLLTSPDVAEDVELAESVSIAMLAVLETLLPTERAVFVLREVFDVPYDEIAGALEKSPAAVRQIATRARKHVAARRPRMSVSRAEQERVVAQFLAALTTGDVPGLLEVLAPDVLVVGDGGGLAPTIPKPVRGAAKLAPVLARFPEAAPASRLSSSTSTAPSRHASTPAVRTTRPCPSSSSTAGSPTCMASATRANSNGWARWPSCDGESGPSKQAALRGGGRGYMNRSRSSTNSRVINSWSSAGQPQTFRCSHDKSIQVPVAGLGKCMPKSHAKGPAAQSRCLRLRLRLAHPLARPGRAV
jgi:RNA polymerase sigma factor (sigma-70 family)